MPGLIDYLKGRRAVQEIRRRQRLIDRPDLNALLGAADLKKLRNQAIRKAVPGFGHRQKEVADYQGRHYSTTSRRLNEEGAEPGPDPILPRSRDLVSGQATRT